MGRGMARNLHQAGLLRAVWNRTPSRANELGSELGVAAATDPAALARECDVIVLCVAADADVLAVVDALLPGLRPGALVIDCSTVSADTAREAARRLAAHGGEFLDAPVSGGVEGARDGTLAIMAGGTDTAFARAQPALQAMGRTITHFGPSGSGQAANFVNRAPNIVRDSFPAGFRVRLHEKDLRICRDMAARFGVELPVVEATLAQYQELIAQGHGDEDISVLFRLKDALFTAAAARPGARPRKPA